MPKKSAKSTHKKHVSSKKMAIARHAASVRRVSAEKDLHHMIRLIGSLFPLRQDKDTKKELGTLSDLSKKKGFKSLYGLIQGLLAEDVSHKRLEKASNVVIDMFKKESGIDLTEKTHAGHAGKAKKSVAQKILRKL